jgi:hypothetical protein
VLKTSGRYRSGRIPVRRAWTSSVASQHPSKREPPPGGLACPARVRSAEQAPSQACSTGVGSRKRARPSTVGLAAAPKKESSPGRPPQRERPGPRQVFHRRGTAW